MLSAFHKVWRVGAALIGSAVVFMLTVSARPAEMGRKMVELRIVTLKNPDRSKVVCTATNSSRIEMVAWRGYDGEHNRLLSRVGGFPLLLYSTAGRASSFYIAPGATEELWSLPLHGIFLREKLLSQRRWSWGWEPPAPRGAPPPTPLLSFCGLSRVARPQPDIELYAVTEISGQRVLTPPLRMPVATLGIQEVQLHARCLLAKPDGPDRESFRVTFEVVQILSGTMGTIANEFHLDETNGAQQFLGMCKARWNDQKRAYDLGGTVLRLTFHLDSRPGGPALVLIRFEPKR